METGKSDPLQGTECTRTGKRHHSETKTRVLGTANKQRQRRCRISLSEIMAILILFHMSHYRTFKYFYLNCVLKDLRGYFPEAVSYERFVQLEEYA